MYYNLDLFGKEVCRIRNKLNLTQNYVSKIAGINMDTLRKIENGKVIPRQGTLDLISIALKKDLNTILLKYRLDNYNKFEQLKNRIENKLESGDFKNLEIELGKLDKLLSNDMNTYFSKLGKQLYLLVESVILKINNNDYHEALNSLIQSISITTINFSLTNYKDFIYSTMEIRILMNIALILNKLESKEKCLELLLFCVNSLAPEETELKIKIFYNISYTFHRLLSHENAFYYSNKGINICVESNSLSCLALLHFRKGIAGYFLEKDNYMDSIQTSISICELSGQHDLKNKLVNSCRKFYNINV